MAEAERISPEVVNQKIKAGTALLVCAYDDEDKCRTMHLQGALLPSQFKSKLPLLSKDQEIIFYCA